MTREQLKDRKDIIELSKKCCGKAHLCCTCKHSQNLNIHETDIDENACNFARRMQSFRLAGCWEFEGFEITDSGCGYWITSCPYYINENEVQSNITESVEEKVMKMYKVPKYKISVATSYGNETDFDIFGNWIIRNEIDYYGNIFCGMLEKQFAKLFGLKDIKSSCMLEENHGKWFDHARVYRSSKTGKGYVVSHLYYPKPDNLLNLFKWCEENELDVTILPQSWYYPNVATAVQITTR